MKKGLVGFITKNASTILTCIGTIGVIVTAIMARKDTIKAEELVNDAQEEKGEYLTKSEQFKAAAPAYIPTALAAVSTIACIFGSHVISKRQQAALLSAYALLSTSYRDYRQRVRAMYGEDTHDDNVSDRSAESVLDIRTEGEYYGLACELEEEENDGLPRTFYDEYSNRHFEATIEQVLKAEYELNRCYILNGQATLNDFYENLGLKKTDYGSILGWRPLDESMIWIDFIHRKVTLDDGMEIYIIEMPFEPELDCT